MSRRIVLYDVDSRIPNLALMKLSTYYKNLGFEVILSNEMKYIDADKHFASSIFYNSRSQNKISTLKKIYGEDIEIGGSGMCLKKRLPDKVQKCFPDYNLYNHSLYALGFLTRGCNKKCSFCIVPEKEGIVKKISSSFEDFVPPEQKNIKLLDDNILAYHGVKNILKEIIQKDYAINFSQSLDISYVNEDISKLLLSINSMNARFTNSMIYFSCNTTKTIRDFTIRESFIQSYKKKFGKNSITILAMFGFNTTLQEDYERIIFIKKMGLIPFFQKYHPIIGVKPQFPANFFNMDLNDVIKLTFKSNGQNWEKYLRWINKLYFKTFGKYYFPLVKIIYKYNNKKAINKYIKNNHLLTNNLYKRYNNKN